MAARRSFQAGDDTPVTRPAERLPLRNLQNELLGQQLALSTNKPASSKSFKKKGEGLPRSSPLHSASNGVAAVAETELAKENAAATITAEEDESVLQKGLSDSLGADLVDKGAGLQSDTSFSSVLMQLGYIAVHQEHPLTGSAQEWVDLATVADQWASAGCLSDSSTSCLTQIDTEDSEPSASAGTGEVTFKSLHCSGVELEVADASSFPEESVLPLPGCAADVSDCCSSQNDLSDRLELSQDVDLSYSRRRADHAYAATAEPCPRDDLPPGGASVLETEELKDPPDGLDQTGQTLTWGSLYLESMLKGSLSQLLQEYSIWSSSAVEPDLAMPSFTADQSQGTAEKGVTADQSQGTVTPDQSQGTAEKGVTADQSLGTVTADQSQSTAEKGVTADQSQSTAEKGVTADQSLGTVTPDQSQGTTEKGVTADQSQSTAEKGVTADQSLGTVTPDQSQSTAEKGVTADQSLGTVTPDQSQGTTEKGVTADQSQSTAETSLAIDQWQGCAEKSLAIDQSQHKMENSVTADQSQGTAEDSLVADQLQCSVTAGESHNSAKKSVTADQSQGSADKSLVADQSQDKLQNSVTADQSQGSSENRLAVGQSQNTAVHGLGAECDKGESCTDLQTRDSDVTTEHAQERHPEATSCVETGSPTLRDGGPGGPWDAADSPVGPRGSRLSMANLESPMPLPQLNSTLIHTLLRSAPTTPQIPPSTPTTPQISQPILPSTTATPQILPSTPTTPQTLPSNPTTPQTLPSNPTTPQTLPSNPTTPQTLPSTPTTPQTLPSTPTTPQTLPSTTATPQTLPSTTATPQILPSTTATPQILPSTTATPQTSQPILSSTTATPKILPSTPATPKILPSNIATPQTSQAVSVGALPTLADRGVGLQPGPLQTPEDQADPQAQPLQANLEPQTPRRPTGTNSGPLPETLGPLWTPGGLMRPQSGPLQERLLQMGALLLRASQSLAPAVQCHSASTWTSPVLRAERSANTSGLFEPRREVCTAEASTCTDSLPWNLAPEAVAGWSRRDLEQRLFSSLVMVEALSQQLASARNHTPPSAPPSQLRDRLVQTDHTELSQGVLYRELCARALERVQALELQQEQQERLLQELQNSRTAMAAMAVETGRALSCVNEMADMASQDKASISQQMSRLRALYGRFRDAQGRMESRAQHCLQEKLLAEQQREEAFRTKEAAVLVLEQLQRRHAAQVAELERSVGSHLELIPALSHACQEQVSLNEEYDQSLQAADELLKDTLRDQSQLSEELSRAQFLLRRTGPVLLQLSQKAAAALRAQNQQKREADRVQEELELTASHLHDAQQQVGDLTLQVTILSSEMAVLRQRLDEVEEERAQAEMKSTELSATLSSTQASCSVLQQALSAQTHRLEEVQEEASRRVEELGGAVAERNAQLTHAQECLQELQSQLASTCEINEFLQAESEMSREQVVQSEALVKAHLQGLRERNLECEDLKQELCALRLQRDAVQEEVITTREKARKLLLDMGKQLALASTDITLLHHKVYTLTSALNTTLNTQNPDGSCKDTDPPAPAGPPRPCTRSFVDSVMVAVTADEASETDVSVEECLSAALGSGNSAFTRVPTAAPPKQDEEDSRVPELVAGLGDAVSELVCCVDRVRKLRDRQCEALQRSVSSLQEELDSQAAEYRSQVAALSEQVAHLQSQVEKDAVALQQKAQEERTLRKLCSDLDESGEQQRCENKELRRELQDLRREQSELRSALQLAQSELQILRAGLNDGQAAQCLPALEERVRLQREVDRLRKSLSEAESSQGKLLDRAKRHQDVLKGNQKKLEWELQVLDQTLQTVKQTLSSIPEVVKKCEQLEKLVAFLG